MVKIWDFNMNSIFINGILLYELSIDKGAYVIEEGTRLKRGKMNHCKKIIE